MTTASSMCLDRQGEAINKFDVSTIEGLRAARAEL